MRLGTVCGGVVVLLAAGCGGGGPVTVTGTVTLDGKAVGAIGNPGTIRFQPADPAAGHAAEGFITDGRYEAKVFPGRYEVTISWEKWPDPSTTRGRKPPPGFDEIPPVQLIPAKHTKPGMLTADVSPTEPQVDFLLVTREER
jgi:hypothetical protein